MADNGEVVSKSLLKTMEDPGVESEFYKPFCLGMPEWCPCCLKTERTAKSLKLKRPRVNSSAVPSRQDSTKKSKNDSTRVSSRQEPSKNSKEDDERFPFDVTFDDLGKFKEGECPLNTEKNTDWAFRNFESWRVARNRKYPNEQCPPNVLCSTEDEMCNWLCKYISETRKVDGTEYTPRSLYLLLAGLQRYIRKQNPSKELNVFQDSVFKPVKHVCDSIFKRLHAKGIGTETKVTPVITEAEEDKLWDAGVMSLDNPTGLLRATFFYNGKNFCLRGGMEHRNLKLSQIQKQTSMVDGRMINTYVYQEFGSKNNQGGFSSLNLQNKVVKQHESSSSRCHVKILDKYLQVLPAEAVDKDVFYLKPLASVPPNPDAPWFSSTPIGKNKLNVMVKEMCAEAGISGNFTNHSLRAYGATALFQAGVSEKLIQQCTGHRSLDALRHYERTSETQLLDVSNIMSRKMTAGQVAKESTSMVTAVASGPKPVNTPPSILLSGCTFTGCSISFAGNAVNNNNNDNQVAEETLQGLSYDDVFED